MYNAQFTYLEGQTHWSKKSINISTVKTNKYKAAKQYRYEKKLIKQNNKNIYKKDILI